ncbi:MAG: CPBP family intramembrane metalloprotease [Burkholderiaceae bacterium]|nr:CPBP family intramembrane metalloprotease [Microbacteriaceae bacterium]
MATTELPVTRQLSWGLIPALGISASAFLIFGIQNVPAGWAVLVASLVTAFLIDRALASDLLLIGVGLGIVSTISVEANLDYANIALMGTVLSLSVLVPFLIDRKIYRRRTIVFPVRTGKKWSKFERFYLIFVLVAGWLILPVYFIGSGAYLNWPAIHAPDEIARLFAGVNFVGIWDELFFICTVFAVFRRHFPLWQANILQAIIFVSFLWELGYQSWGPLLTAPFALLQGYIFSKTKSLTYVVCVHLLFDLVVFLVLVHAHNREWLPFFLY